jgi:hypothetical protein
VLRLLLGLVKGAVLGGAVGYGAYALDLRGGMHWISYGLVGVIVGFFVGTPIWKHLSNKSGTIFTPILKAVVGFGFAAGIYALVAKAWGGFDLEIAGESRHVYDWQYIMGAVVGALYGAFVELDDAPDKPAKDE